MNFDTVQSKNRSDDIRSVGRRTVGSVFRRDVALEGCDVDQQNSVIDKTAALEAGADKCHPKPLEFDGFVIAVSERLYWIEHCATA